MRHIEKSEDKPPAHDLFTFEQGEDGGVHVTQMGEDALEKVYGSQSPAVNEALFCQGYTTLKHSEIEDGQKTRAVSCQRLCERSPHRMASNVCWQSRWRQRSLL